MATKNLLLLFKVVLHPFLKIKSHKEVKNSRNQGFSYIGTVPVPYLRTRYRFIPMNKTLGWWIKACFWICVWQRAGPSCIFVHCTVPTYGTYESAF